MGIETVDKRFALVAQDGDVLFPYQKTQISSGRYGFAITAPGIQDRRGGGEYTSDLEEVVKRLVFEGWSARVMTTDKPEKQREGSLGIGKRAIVGYWIADELQHLVKGARVSPIHLPSGREFISSETTKPKTNPARAIDPNAPLRSITKRAANSTIS